MQIMKPCFYKTGLFFWPVCNMYAHSPVKLYTLAALARKSIGCRSSLAIYYNYTC